MDRGPRWTLRLAALLLGSAPFLHLFSSRRGNLDRPFYDLHVLDELFERAMAAWFFCWLLPLVASFPSFRAYWATVAFTFVAYLALLLSMTLSWTPEPPLEWLMGLGAIFLGALLIRRVDAEVVAAWARILIAATLAAACGLQYVKTSAWAVGSAFVLAGAALAGVGEVLAIRSVPAEEKPEA
jgi:hypothetical protein